MRMCVAKRLQNTRVAVPLRWERELQRIRRRQPPCVGANLDAALRRGQLPAAKALRQAIRQTGLLWVLDLRRVRFPLTRKIDRYMLSLYEPTNVSNSCDGA